jgi:hypothetical protein
MIALTSFMALSPVPAQNTLEMLTMT